MTSRSTRGLSRARILKRHTTRPAVALLSRPLPSWPTLASTSNDTELEQRDDRSLSSHQHNAEGAAQSQANANWRLGRPTEAPLDQSGRVRSIGTMSASASCRRSAGHRAATGTRSSRPPIRGDLPTIDARRIRDVASGTSQTDQGAKPCREHSAVGWASTPGGPGGEAMPHIRVSRMRQDASKPPRRRWGASAAAGGGAGPYGG